MKKILKVMSIVCVMMSMCLSSLHNVRGYSDHFTSYTSYSYKDVSRKSYTSNVGRKVSAKDHVTCFYNTGSWLYCIENGQKLSHDASFDKVSDIDDFLNHTIHKKTTNAQKQKWLSILMAIAPRSFSGKAASQTREVYLRYSAAATLVWEIMDECRDAQFHYIGADSGKTAPRDGNQYASLAIRDEFYKYYNEYVKKVEDFVKIPSFSHSTMTQAPVYDMNYNEQKKCYEISLTDKENVLDHFELSGDDCQFQKNGQTLTITTEKKIAHGQTLTIALKDAQNHREGALLGFQASQSSYQKLMCVGEFAPMKTRAYVKIKQDFGSLELEKSDAQKNLIDGAVFHLTNHQDVNKDVVVEKGKLLIEHLKPGRYELYEKQAPHGYIIDQQKYQVEIKAGQVTQKSVINKAAMGKVTIHKSGEQLIDFKDGQFIYQSQGLKGVFYALFANEDIVDVNQNVLYKKGDKVCQMVTDDQGQATSSLLPLGQYICQEVQSVGGFIMNDQPIPVSLDYQGQNKEIIDKQLNISNEREKITVQVKKRDATTKEPLAFATFALITNKDIVNAQGKKIVNANTVLKTVQSSKEGYVSFDIDLPLQAASLSSPLYRIEEVQQPDGYVLNQTHYAILASHTGQQNKIYQVDIDNHKTKVEIIKKDKLSLKPLANAHLQIIDPQTNRIIDEWISSQNAHVVEGLIMNKDYILREVQAPDGYVKADDLHFQMDSPVKSLQFLNQRKIIPPQTGDLQSLTPFYMMIASLTVCLFIQQKKKKVS